jgi:glutathione S-transferase
VAALTLVIGNRNYSSWSLRPWILIQHLGLDCTEHRIVLDTPTFGAEAARFSPTKRVPVLIDGGLTIWESTAILEYLSELGGGRGWPAATDARAVARAATAEMHAGFAALRSGYPMNIRARNRRVPMTAPLGADIARIDALWTECRQRFGSGGPWLFGAYSAADAMYLPVAFRFQTYGLEGLGAVARAYVATAVGDPKAAAWVRAAGQEAETIEREEIGR